MWMGSNIEIVKLLCFAYIGYFVICQDGLVAMYVVELRFGPLAMILYNHVH